MFTYMSTYVYIYYNSYMQLVRNLLHQSGLHLRRPSQTSPERFFLGAICFAMFKIRTMEKNACQLHVMIYVNTSFIYGHATCFGEYFAT